MLHISNTDTLKSIHFPYFISLMKYGIIFLCKSCDGKKVFTLQTQIVRILMSVKSHNSYRDLNSSLWIYTVFSWINFIANNEKHFQTNADVHSANTRHKHCRHKPIAKLSCFQKNKYYAGIKIFSNLPSDLKSLMDEKALIKIVLKWYLNTHSFYSVDEYLLYQKWLIYLKTINIIHWH
jgi:hypothetical protein